ncbi:MAG: hypothetical protein ABMA26_21815 [Limisphaerales bacterium]
MKKWSFIVAALYGLLLMALFGPVVSITFMSKDDFRIGWPVELLKEWSFWLIIAVLVLAQFALLRLPVAVASRRPVKQRSLWITVLAAAFMMTLLVCGAGVSIFEFITKLEPKWDGEEWWWVLAGLGPTTWGVWAIYFYRATHTSAPEIQMGRIKRHLWTGSILELLVAIPTHIVARHRDHCCAGMLTFIGLTCGISVMCFAFGPAVYFLFVERWKRLHPEAAEALATAADVQSPAVAKPPSLTDAIDSMRNR